MKATLVVLVVAGVLVPLAAVSSADPVKCVVVRDGAGNPMDTVCVPVLLH